MAAPRTIYVVLGAGVILNAYESADSAELHARCVTGAKAVPCELLQSVPPEIREDLAVEWESDDDTPVVDPEPVRARAVDERFDKG